MPIIVNPDVVLAQRKMRSKELAERIGIAEQNISLLKSGKVKGARFDTNELR
jgi:putative transcriptional regulator